MRCPTCGASQSASPECRRCKCDLEMVLAVRQQARALHRQYLVHLREGDVRAALAVAIRRHRLAPDPVSRRLLAVACLGLGRFADAAQLAESQ